MSRIAYVNGRYLPFRDAKVRIEDRGYQFGDGVYEVCEVRDGRLIDQRRHLARLVRSLDELRIRMPIPLAALNIVMREVAARNRIGYGLLTCR
jgi:D-alanine transaminase